MFTYTHSSPKKENADRFNENLLEESVYGLTDICEFFNEEFVCKSKARELFLEEYNLKSIN